MGNTTLKIGSGQESGVTDPYRTLQILEEVAKGKPMTQRDLSKKLGIGLGMVNSYLKRLADQGLIQIYHAERRRLHYLLTPRGIAEKSALAYRSIKHSYQLFMESRSRIRDFFLALEREDVRSIVLYKTTVIAEISLLALQESSLDLVAIVDDNGSGKRFLGYRVQPVQVLQALAFDRILVTTEEPIEEVEKHLSQYGVEKEKICGLV